MSSGEQGPVAWLRQAVRQRLYLARHAIELGNNAAWLEQSSGVLVTGPPSDRDVWEGTWPMGDSSLTRLMEANDPQDTIARCEAELAILDEHRILCRGEMPEGYEEFSVTYPPGIAGMDCGCATCHYRGHGGVSAYGICRTVKFVASGYRHWDGYRKEGWEPGVRPWKAPTIYPG
jgi:hypothetical protein